MNANEHHIDNKPAPEIVGAARIVRGLPPTPDNMNRRDAMRMAAMVAAYAVDRAARKLAGDIQEL